jgi:hypothetical protein
MTAKIYELLQNYADLLFEYAWAGGEYEPKDAAKAALIAEIDRLVEVERKYNEAQNDHP